VTLICILPCLGEGEGPGIHVLYSDRGLKWLAVCMVSYGFSRDGSLQAAVNTSCGHEALVLT